MQLDEFESRFKRASKDVFEYKEVHYKRIMLVTDMSREEAEALRIELGALLAAIPGDAEWLTLSMGDFDRVLTLLERIDEFKPDLIVTYRNLRHLDKQQSYTLGVYCDVLTQATLVPVLIIPFPRDPDFQKSMSQLNQVLVVTDHAEGDYKLIDMALPFVGHNGRLTLAHIENQIIFDRYMSVIEKVPEVNTEQARAGILNVLLQAPQDYIASAQADLSVRFPEMAISSIVSLGVPHNECERLSKEQGVGLIVANTKDDNQLAMQGDAYAIAIQLRSVPLLLL